MTLESFQHGALEKLKDGYIKIGMETQNRELLLKEIKRLKSLKIQKGIHCGEVVFQDEEPQRLLRVAAFRVGLAVKSKQFQKHLNKYRYS